MQTTRIVTARYQTLRFLLLGTFFAGCMTPPPDNGNGNTNGNGNSNSGSPLTLSDSQKANVNEASRLFQKAAQTFGTALSGVVGPAFDPENPSVIGLFGTCPSFSFVSSTDAVLGSLSFSTPSTMPECTSEDAGDKTVSGLAAFTMTRSNRSASVTFTNFVIDGVAISGGATLVLSGNSNNGVQFQGTANITIGDITVNGALTFIITSSGAITFDSTGLTVSDADSNFALTLDDVVVNPITNNNYVPQSGVMTFAAGGETVSVTFSSASPSTRVVQVRVNGAGPASFTLP